MTCNGVDVWAARAVERQGYNIYNNQTKTAIEEPKAFLNF
jgi:hypothetical protein